MRGFFTASNRRLGHPTIQNRSKPGPPVQLLFLLGAVCLFVTRDLRWNPSPTDYAVTGRLVYAWELALFGSYAVQFAGAAGYLVCFRLGSHPARRLLYWVCLPAFVGLILQSGVWVYIALASPVGRDTATYAGRNGSLLSVVRNLGPGFHYGVAGLLLVALFTSRVALGSVSLPLALAESDSRSVDATFRWSHMQILIWLAAVWLPLVWCGALVFLGVSSLRTSYRLLIQPGLTHLVVTFFLHDFPSILFIGLTVLIIGREAWELLRRSLRLPLPESFALAAAFPFGISLLVSLGEYFFARGRWTLGLFVGALPPQFGSYFNLPTVGLTFSLLLPAFFEEAIHRGLLQPLLIRRYGLVRGIVFVGIVWGAGHFYDDFSPRLNDAEVFLRISFRLAGAIAMSGVLGWPALKTGSILPATLAHGVFNSLVESSLRLKLPGQGILTIFIWGLLAYVLFWCWPVQVEVVTQRGDTKISAASQTLQA